VTPAVYQPLEQALPLQAIDELGAAASIWISCVLVASTLPATSQARYLTVVVVETVKGFEYSGLAVVGSEPSVV
jgi:hypothetical protein